jgi:hypothetical protein
MRTKLQLYLSDLLSASLHEIQNITECLSKHHALYWPDDCGKSSAVSARSFTASWAKETERACKPAEQCRIRIWFT